jgi:hypothetical protein
MIIKFFKKGAYMSKAISEYYEDELVRWADTINFYFGEISDLENRLAGVIQRNTIPHIAEKVESEQEKLDGISVIFNQLQELILRQEKVLKTDSTLIDDALINTETANQQDDLRRRLQAAEKDYIDTKFSCYNFLSNTFKK